MRRGDDSRVVLAWQENGAFASFRSMLQLQEADNILRHDTENICQIELGIEEQTARRVRFIDGMGHVVPWQQQISIRRLTKLPPRESCE